MPEPEIKHFQCRHIFPDGYHCGSKCLRREPFCYYHHTTRRPAPGRHANAPESATSRNAFDLPLLDDRSAIQASIAEIARRLAQNQLNTRRAGLLLYAMQIASANLPRLARASAEPRQMVEELTLHPPSASSPPKPNSTPHPPKSPSSRSSKNSGRTTKRSKSSA